MDQEQWTAIKNNDRAYDGVFYYALKTTKNVCRPSCCARRCNPKNVIIFDTLKDALEAGFRPCSRCRPDLPDWKGSKFELAKSAEKYIEAHYTDKFSLKEISDALYVNGNYLLRAFKEVTGQTLLRYHNFVRCREAAQLLKRPECSIAYISGATGYVNAAHFSKVFKTYYNMTPSQYRKAHFESFSRD